VVVSCMVPALAFAQRPPPATDPPGDAGELLPLPRFMIELPVADLGGRYKIIEDDKIEQDTVVAVGRAGQSDMLVFVALPADATSCATAMETRMADLPPAPASELGLDATFHGTTRVKRDPSGKLTHVACVQLPRGRMMVTWGTEGTVAPSVRTAAVRLMNAMARAYLARANGAPQRLRVAPGLDVEVRDRSVLWHVAGGAILRADGPRGLGANVAVSDTTSCAQEVAAWRALRWDIATSPPYLPAGWNPSVGIASNDGTTMIVMCMDRRGGGSIELQWLGGDQGSPTFGPVIRPVLEAFVAGHGVPPPAPAPAFGAAPAPAPEPSPASTSSPSTDSTLSESIPTWEGGEDVTDRQISVAYQELRPGDETMATGTGGALRLDYPIRTVDDSSRVAYELAAAVGYDDQERLGLDARLTVGYLLGGDRLSLAPVAGLGVDYLGGADAAFHLDAGLDVQLGAIGRLLATERVAVEVRAIKFYRSGPVDETELSARLVLLRPGRRKIVLDGFRRTYDGEGDGDGARVATTLGFAAGIGF